MSKPPAKPPFDPETGTLPDDIPPVHVLEAAHAQDRKEAEELLSGFNRPGREPKRPVEERDFVDYYTRKKEPPAPPRPRVAANGAAPTQLKPRWDERPPRETPPWLGWVGICALMIAIGGIVAFVATSEPSHAAKSAAATTITASSVTGETSRDAIPPPPPPLVTAAAAADPTAMTTTPITVTPSTPWTPSTPSAAARTKRDRHSPPNEPAVAVPTPARATPLPAAATGTTGPTRDDLIRDM